MNVFADAEYTMVEVALLVVDRSYQRDQAEKRVARMVAEGFDVALFGALAVARYPDGSLNVWDGGHRLALAVALGIAKVPCMIVERTAEQAAGLFSRRSETQKRLRPWEAWRADLRSSEPTVVAIDAVVREAGFELAGTAKTGTQIGAIEVVRKIERDGGIDHLGRTLAAAQPWRRRETPVLGHVLRGVSLFLKRHPETNDATLRSVLSVASPRTLDQQATLRRTSSGGSNSATAAIADVIELMVRDAEDPPDLVIKLAA